MNLLLWSDVVTEELLPAIEYCAAAGFDGVEVPLIQTDFDASAWGTRLADLGLQVTAVAVRGEEDNPAAADGAIRQVAIDRTRQAIDACAEMGGTILAGPLHSALGLFSGQGPTDDEWAWSVDSMQHIAAHAEAAGVTLAIEALNRFECYLINTQADAERYLIDVGSPACVVLYDSFHANIEEKHPATALRDVASNVGHVHISENDRSTPGAGNVGWDELFDALAAIGYDGWLTIEAFGLALPRFAAATRIWRPMFESEEQLASDGLAFMKDSVERAFGLQ